MVYRTAILSVGKEADAEKHSPPAETDSVEPNAEQSRDSSEPPVEEGEVREVDIDDIGNQGNGITSVELGFVVIIPDTEQGERVTIEITDMQPNVAFAEVKERQTLFK